MTLRRLLLQGLLAVFAAYPLAAQNPALSGIEGPYPTVQTTVHIAGNAYGPGAVSYGPAKTPLILTGSNFGSSGTVYFPGSTKGTTIAATTSSWSTSKIVLVVPTGATSGLVTVSSSSLTSNGLPFIVNPGTYGTSCPATAPSSVLDIGTSSLPGGTIGQGYSVTLSAAGGTSPYTWSLASGSLPPGLTLAASTGVISGTPSSGAGQVTLTVKATDSLSQAADAVLNLSLNKGVPTITWPAPAAITYGTALSATQLDATASVAGSFVYTPAAATVPKAGTDTLSATFTPTDTTDYTTATKTVSLTVNKATPTITWAAPAAITYGTALSATQLDATASVAGSFAYTPAAGTVPTAGTDTLSVTFTPTDSADYSVATKTVSLTVNKATPAITWATPSPIAYGTALSATQLNATASVPGTLAYSPAAGTVPAAGTDTLSVTLTPSSANYAVANKSTSLTVIAIPTMSLSATSVSAGSTLTISGTNFGATQGSSILTIGGNPVTVTSWSATSINLIVPGTLGAGAYTVLLAVDGIADATAQLNIQGPAITGLSLNQGPVGMGFTITGTNFGPNDAAANTYVELNGTAMNTVSWSSTSIVVQVPAGATPGNVVVTVNGSPSNGLVFTVQPAFGCN